MTKCEHCSKSWEHERRCYTSDYEVDDGMAEMEADGWQVAAMSVYKAGYNDITLFYDVVFKRVRI